MDLRMEGMVFQTTPHLFCLHVHVGGMVLIGKVKVGYSQFRFSMNTGPSQFRLITLNYVRDTEKIIFMKDLVRFSLVLALFTLHGGSMFLTEKYNFLSFLILSTSCSNRH